MLKNDKIDAFTEEVSKDYSQQTNSEIAMYKQILGEDFSFSDVEEPVESDSNNRTHTISFRVAVLVLFQTTNHRRMHIPIKCSTIIKVYFNIVKAC